MTVSPLTLDRFDRRILDVLQVEGRISNQEFAIALLTPGAGAGGAWADYPVPCGGGCAPAGVSADGIAAHLNGPAHP